MAPAGRMVQLCPLIHRLAGAQGDVGREVLLLFRQRSLELLADRGRLCFKLLRPWEQLAVIERDGRQAGHVELVGMLAVWLGKAGHH
jgi:hypothetical protein